MPNEEYHELKELLISTNIIVKNIQDDICEIKVTRKEQWEKINALDVNQGHLKGWLVGMGIMFTAMFSAGIAWFTSP